MIKLICDSTSYLPQELIEKYDIDIIPLSVILGPEVIVETQVTNESFFAKLHRSAFHPTSTQPSVQSVYTVFEKYVSQGDSVLFVSISSDQSGTYSTADSVKNMILEKYPDAQIEIVDSRTNCMQHGYAVLAGAKALEQGNDMDQALQAIKDTMSKSRLLFIPETLKYLQESGRLSKASALMASALKIVPILTVKDGKPDLYTKIRTRNSAKKVMLDELASDINAGGVTDISVLHINKEAEARKYMESINELIDIDINLSEIGPVIGAHVGPGAIGLAWVKA
jgi:DegV family protein with EDD domain